MEIQRYSIVRWQNGAVASFGPHQAGEFVRYTDLLWERRQRHMSYVVNVILLTVCIALSAYLVVHKYDPKPVVVSAERPQRTAEIERGLATVQQLEATLEEKKRNDAQHEQDLERIKRLELYAANLAAKIREQNKKATPAEQTEVLRAASTMPDRDVLALAREVGFSNIRVGE